jgi:hypothetical protein
MWISLFMFATAAAIALSIAAIWMESADRARS